MILQNYTRTGLFSFSFYNRAFNILIYVTH